MLYKHQCPEGCWEIEPEDWSFQVNNFEEVAGAIAVGPSSEGGTIKEGRGLGTNGTEGLEKEKSE